MYDVRSGGRAGQKSYYFAEGASHSLALFSTGQSNADKTRVDHDQKRSAGYSYSTYNATLLMEGVVSAAIN